MDKHIPGTEKKPYYIASMIPESPDLAGQDPGSLHTVG